MKFKLTNRQALAVCEEYVTVLEKQATRAQRYSKKWLKLRDELRQFLPTRDYARWVVEDNERRLLHR